MDARKFDLIVKAWKGSLVLLAVFGLSFAFGNSAYAAETAGCAVEGQAWLLVLGQLVKDPVKWIMYGSGVMFVVSLAWGGWLIKMSKGRQDKLDKGFDAIKWLAVGTFVIFSASGIGTWFLSKFGCTI